MRPMPTTVLTACVLANALPLLLLCACDATPAKPMADAGAAAAKTTSETVKPRDPLAAKLLAGKWTGTLGEQDPFELTFTEDRDALAAQLLLRRFGRSIMREHLKVTLEPPAGVRLKGTRATPLVGKGPAPLHEITATVAADVTTVSGTVVSGDAPKGVPFTATTKKAIGEVDPPLDVARAEAALVGGKWEGKAGDEPAKLAVARQGTRLSGRFTHAGTVIPVEVKALPDGVVTLTAPPQRTGQRQVTATFEVAFARLDLGEVSGTYKVVTQLGVVMQAQSYPLALQDRRPRKKAP
jgi:hypothetical protein